MGQRDVDAIVVGSGPNGLAAAIALAQAGRSVLGARGGGRDRRRGAHRGADAAGLPARRVLGDPPARARRRPSCATLPLPSTGCELVHPEIPLAHPLDDGTAVALHRSVDETAAGLGRRRRRVPPADGAAVPGAARRSSATCSARCACRAIRSPLARFGLRGSALGGRPRPFALRRRARAGAARRQRGPLDAAARAAGDRRLRAHAAAARATASAGLSAAAARRRSPTRWRRCCARSAARSRPGGEVRSLRELPSARARAARPDAAPDPADRRRRAAAALPPRARALSLRPGRLQARLGARRADPLDGAGVPRGRAPCTSAARSRRSRRPRRRSPAAGIRERPFVLVAPAEPVRPDARARPASTRCWAYCHVPHGSTRRHDRGDRGADRALRARLPRARSSPATRSGPRRSRRTTPTTSAATSTAAPPDLRQLFARPAARPRAVRTPDPRLFICSSSTPPGGGVHGMCGFFAARAALRRVLR